MLMLLLLLLVIAAVIATRKSNGSMARTFKIFFLGLLGVLVIGAGICVLILGTTNFGNMH